MAEIHTVLTKENTTLSDVSYYDFGKKQLIPKKSMMSIHHLID